MLGRKPKYDIKSLQIGQKMALKGMAKKFSNQYVYSFNQRGPEKYKRIVEGREVFVERVA